MICVGAWLADLDQVRVTVEAEGLAAGGSDVERAPEGLVEEGDGGVADGFEAGQAVGDLCAELGGCSFFGLAGSDGDFYDVFLRDAWDGCAGGFGVGGDGDGADEAEVNDVAGQDGVVAVAEGLEDVGVGEHLSR